MDCDVGLIWLARPLEFSDRVAPINLYEQGVEIEGGEEAFVTGWGNLRVSIINTLQKYQYD